MFENVLSDLGEKKDILNFVKRRVLVLAWKKIFVKFRLLVKIAISDGLFVASFGQKTLFSGYES